VEDFGLASVVFIWLGSFAATVPRVAGALFVAIVVSIFFFLCCGC
jgi:hypothetical protein